MKLIHFRDAIQDPPRMRTRDYVPYLLALLFYAALTAVFSWLSVLN